MKKGRVIAYFILILLLFLGNFYFRPIEGNPNVTDEFKNSQAYINGLYASDEFFKNTLLDPEYYYMYYEFIDAIEAHQSKINIQCEKDCNDEFSLIYKIVMMDHPELLNYYGGGKHYYQNGYLTYTNTSYLNNIQYWFGTRRIEREMENIRNDTKNMTDKEKIIYVYDYVASRDYDKLFTYVGSNQSAYSFFTKGESVCAGFAKASQMIFQNIGIKSYLVLNTDHLWNYVEYEGKYYVFDATYGASFYDKSHPMFYNGLGESTVGEKSGFFSEIYPPVEDEKLKDIFGL